jgi:hypothetical protein
VLDVVSLGVGVGVGVVLGEVAGDVLGEVAGDDAGGWLNAGGDVLHFVTLEGLLDGPDDGARDELPAAGVPTPDGWPLPEAGFVPVGEVWFEVGEKSPVSPPIAA